MATAKIRAGVRAGVRAKATTDFPGLRTISFSIEIDTT
jgi:hypothetical protein